MLFLFLQHCDAASAPRRNQTAEFLFLLCQAAVSLDEDFLSPHGEILRGELRVVLFDFANPDHFMTGRGKGKVHQFSNSSICNFDAVQLKNYQSEQ